MQEEKLGQQNSSHKPSLRRTIKRRTLKRRTTQVSSDQNEMNQESCKANSSQCKVATQLPEQSKIETLVVNEDNFEPPEQVIQKQVDDSISIFISHELDMEIQVAEIVINETC